MNLIQTDFRDDGRRKTPDVAQVIHRKYAMATWLGTQDSKWRYGKRQGGDHARGHRDTLPDE